MEEETNKELIKINDKKNDLNFIIDNQNNENDELKSKANELLLKIENDETDIEKSDMVVNEEFSTEQKILATPNKEKLLLRISTILQNKKNNINVVREEFLKTDKINKEIQQNKNKMNTILKDVINKVNDKIDIQNKLKIENDNIKNKKEKLLSIINKRLLLEEHIKNITEEDKKLQIEKLEKKRLDEINNQIRLIEENNNNLKNRNNRIENFQVKRNNLKNIIAKLSINNNKIIPQISDDTIMDNIFDDNNANQSNESKNDSFVNNNQNIMKKIYLKNRR